MIGLSVLDTIVGSEEVLRWEFDGGTYVYTPHVPSVPEFGGTDFNEAVVDAVKRSWDLRRSARGDIRIY
jgi:hypothetical protein